MSTSSNNSASGDALCFGFARHGVTELNLRGLRCGGDLDVELTDAGRLQAEKLGRDIRHGGLSFGIILCGSLKRTRDSARIISAALGDLPIVDSPLLDERALGEWNGQSIAATESALASNEPPPGGETEEAFAARIEEALIEVREHAEQLPLIISSKGVGRMMHKLLGGEGRLLVENGDLVVFRCQPGIPSRLRIERPLAG